MYRTALAIGTSISLAATGAAFGQATASGAVVGNVTDATGAALPGAQVTVTNTGTNAKRSIQSSTAGEFRFDLLPAGNYTVHVEAAGFGPADTGVLTLQVGSSVTANVPLRAGSISQTVEVSTDNQLVDTEKTDSSQNITTQQIEDLPTNGRDFANLAVLAPGVKLVDSYDPTKNRIAVYAVNGSSGRNTNTTVNGIDNKDNTIGGAVMQLPLEAVAEFKISTARFSAENGRSEGAALNVITKSGTNKYHGSLYAFFRSQELQEKNALDVAANNPVPPFSRQQYGGSFGGYIRKDKDFGFFAYEGLRERASLSVGAATLAELTLAIPLGAQPEAAIPAPYDDKRYNGRIDHVFSSKTRGYFSYTAQDNKSQNDQSTNQVDATEGNFTLNDLILSNVALTTQLGTHSVNIFTAGFQYWNNLIDSTTRAPYFLFPDGNSFGTNPNVPQKSSQHKFQFRDDYSYSKGKHTLKFGVDDVYEPQVGGFFENNPTPEFDFFDTAFNLTTNKVKYPNGFSTAGVIQNSTGTSGDPSFDLAYDQIGFYFQDDWRVTRKLLLNLGIRYDRDGDTYGQAKQAQNRTHQELVAAAATNVPTLPTAQLNQSGVTGETPSLAYLGGTYTGLPKTDSKDVSPRVGFAYDVFGTGKVVVRGGYGLYFGQTFENIPLFLVQQANNQVFANTYSITCKGPGDLTCNQTVPGTNILLSNYRYGVDPAPVIPAASFNLAPGSLGRTFASNFRNPYTQQFNFGLQVALTKTSVLELEYVGALGEHEDKTINLNPIEYFAPGRPRPFTAAFQAAGVPVLASIREEASIGRSYYDAANVSYRATVNKHVTTTVNYTYSKALAFEGNPAAFRNTATNPFLGQFRHADYGRAPNDETHHVTAAGTFSMKYGVEISPILQAGSSRPYDAVESSSDLFGIGSGRSNPHAALLPGQRPTPANFAALYARASASGSVANFYTTCLANGSCVETSYNSLSGTPVIQLDARVGKSFLFRERYKANLFFQGFNITNRANYGGNYNGNVSTASAFTPLGFVNPSSSIVPRAFTAEFGGRFSF